MVLSEQISLFFTHFWKKEMKSYALFRHISSITQFLNRLVQMFPDSADAYAARAAFETEQKQYDIALYDWDEAIRRHPLNSGFVVSKVDVLLSLYRKDEARDELNAAVKRGIPRYALKEWFDKCKK